MSNGWGILGKVFAVDPRAEQQKKAKDDRVRLEGEMSADAAEALAAVGLCWHPWPPSCEGDKSRHGLLHSTHLLHSASMRPIAACDHSTVEGRKGDKIAWDGNDSDERPMLVHHKRNTGR